MFNIDVKQIMKTFFTLGLGVGLLIGGLIWLIVWLVS